MAQEEQVTTLKDALDDGLEDWERQAIQKGKAAAACRHPEANRSSR